MTHYWNNLQRILSKTGKQEELKVFVDKKKKEKKKKEAKVPKQDAQICYIHHCINLVFSG
jgi:hypothetical protein